MHGPQWRDKVNHKCQNIQPRFILGTNLTEMLGQKFLTEMLGQKWSIEEIEGKVIKRPVYHATHRHHSLTLLLMPRCASEQELGMAIF